MGKDEGTPKPHAGDHVFEVGGHADTDLLCFLALEGVYQLGLLHDIVDTVQTSDTNRYSGIIGIHGSALFIGMQLQPVFRENFNVLHVIKCLYAFRSANVVKIR